MAATGTCVQHTIGNSTACFCQRNACKILSPDVIRSREVVARVRDTQLGAVSRQLMWFHYRKARRTPCRGTAELLRARCRDCGAGSVMRQRQERMRGPVRLLQLVQPERSRVSSLNIHGLSRSAERANPTQVAYLHVSTVRSTARMPLTDRADRSRLMCHAPIAAVRQPGAGAGPPSRHRGAGTAGIGLSRLADFRFPQRTTFGVELEMVLSQDISIAHLTNMLQENQLEGWM
eukprot:353534-Chlamydomonas_euryale.AAC.4